MQNHQDHHTSFVCRLIHNMDNEMAWIAIYDIKEEGVVQATSLAIGYADDPMSAEPVILFNILDLRVNEGVIVRCSFTPNDLNIGLQFHNLEDVVGMMHWL